MMARAKVILFLGNRITKATSDNSNTFKSSSSHDGSDMNCDSQMLQKIHTRKRYTHTHTPVYRDIYLYISDISLSIHTHTRVKKGILNVVENKLGGEQ